MSKRSSPCGRFLSIIFSIAQGSATGLGTFDNIRDKFGLATGVGLGFMGFVIRTTTAYFFQGNVIRKIDKNEQNIQGHHSYHSLLQSDTQSHHSHPQEMEYIEEQPRSICSLAAAPTFVLLDASLNFSDHSFTWRQLSQSFFDLDDEIFWIILVTSFLIQQLFYMCHEGYEATHEIGRGKPFYTRAFRCLSRENKTARKLFREIGAIHHTIFEFAPWFLSFPQIIPFLCHYPMSAGIPIGVFLIFLSILLYDQTNLFEGQHTEHHLAEEEKYIEPVSISPWRAKIIRKTIFLMAPFHGAVTAMPNYIIPSREISAAAGIPLGIFTFLGTAVGTYQSEVKEAKERLDQMLTKNEPMMLLTI